MVTQEYLKPSELAKVLIVHKCVLLSRIKCFYLFFYFLLRSGDTYILDQITALISDAHIVGVK